MANVTIDKKIVQRLSGVSPMPAHDLVVFDQIGRGERYREMVPPGADFRVPFLEKLFRGGESQIAYAVTQDPNLHHSLDFSCFSRDQLGPLKIRASIHFRVTNSRFLAENWPNDPLKRLADHLTELATRAIGRLDWADIEDGKVDIEKEVLNTESTDETGRSLPHIEILRNAAPQLGFKLKNIRITTSLPEKIPELREKIRDQQRERRLTLQEQEIGVEKDRLEFEREKEKKLAQERLENEVEILREERRSVNASGEALRNLTGRAVNALGTAMDGVANRIETVPELTRAFQELRTIQRQAGAISEGTIEVTATNTPALADKSPALLTAATGERGRLGRYVAKLLQLSGALPCDPTDRKRLVSIGLHLLAEAYLGEAADSSLLTRFSEDLEDQFTELVEAGALDNNEQRELLNQLRDSETLKEKLG